MRSPIWICKKNEIACHIRRLFDHYGEDIITFDEYLAEVLKQDIDHALTCFRDLVNQLKWMPKGKKNEEPQQGLQDTTSTHIGTYQLQPPFRR